MECTNCDKLTGDYMTDKETCAYCRDVLKVDIAYMLQGMTPIYLSEHNRNKQGRKRKLTATQQGRIKYRYTQGESMGALAKEYGVSKGTIWNIVHKY